MKFAAGVWPDGWLEDALGPGGAEGATGTGLIVGI
jgi:hypothetical protein